MNGKPLFYVTDDDCTEKTLARARGKGLTFRQEEQWVNGWYTGLQIEWSVFEPWP